MTVTRIGQLSAENRYTSAYITNGSVSSTVISSTKANTGTYSYFVAGSTPGPIGLGFSSRSEIRASVYLNHSGLILPSSSQAIIFQVFPLGGSNSTSHRVIWNGATSNLEMYVNGVLVGSASVATYSFNTPNTWINAAITFKGHASAGFFSLYINGVLAITFSGNTTGVSVSACYFGGTIAGGGTGGWNSGVYCDDFYVDDTTGELDSCPSGRRFLPSFPDGAGANAAFTGVSGANWVNVSETLPDSDTSYNKALSAGLRDTFTTGNIVVPANHVIRAVIIIPIVRKTDAGTDAKLSMHSYDGATYQDGSDQALTTAYATTFERQTLQPDGSAWSQTPFNAMQFGYRSRGTF